MKSNHTRAVDLEHRLKVAANQARDDVHNGVIILALRVLEQQSGFPCTGDSDPDAPRKVDPDADVKLTSVEAAVINHATDRKAPVAHELLEATEQAIAALDHLRHTAKRLTAGLDTQTYARRCTDAYSAACRDRDMIDPRGAVGQCDACRKRRDRDRDESRNVSV